MILIDSCGWLEFLADGSLAEKYAPYFDKPAEIVTPAVVVYDVTKKILREQGKEKAVLVAAQMQQTRLVPFDARLAVSAAELSLRWGLPMADAIVYATAIECGCGVVTGDNHFRGLPRVVFVPHE
ncbi:MAG TPA: type II toxin-antitoxin system VapC family toxin [Desulfotomaculum sp.]|nr:type II toxin-antitoxin system VapC family toxin [Desulfotomaculum sp.]